jgi:alpha-tubulin suppressor-like RCC1 family protein
MRFTLCLLLAAFIASCAPGPRVATISPTSAHRGELITVYIEANQEIDQLFLGASKVRLAKRAPGEYQFRVPVTFDDGSFDVSLEQHDRDGTEPRLEVIGYEDEPVFTQAAVGPKTACAVDDTQRLWCWGEAPGDGGLFAAEVPIPVLKDERIVEVRLMHASNSGASPICAKNDADKLYCWSGQDGQLLPHLAAEEVLTIAGTRNHPCWISSDNVIDCVSEEFDIPPVILALQWKTVDLNEMHGCGITLEDKLFCWGGNTYGQLGNGTTSDAPVSVAEVVTAGPWRHVSTGSFLNFGHSCALETDETLWCWGVKPQIDEDRTLHYSTYPYPVTGGYLIDGTWAMHPQWQVLESASYHACAIAEGDLFCWGFKQDPSIITPDITIPQPSQIGADATWTDVSLADERFCGITAEGQLYCWGQFRYPEDIALAHPTRVTIR